MKPLALMVGLVTVLLAILPLRADNLPWMVTWFPWNATYASWDWTGGGRSITIESEGPTPFPASVKTWDLAVCSASDPARQALIPLPNPLSVDAHGNRNLDLGLWTPGGFPAGQLDALGEGTFLCAIVGDGQRHSNVSRVNISHDYQRTPMAGVRVFALAFPDEDIRRIAVRVVPAPGEDLHLMDLAFPAISVKGTWHRPTMMNWEGPNSELNSGESYVRIVSLDNYNPPIPTFKKADVEVKLIQNFDKASFTLPAAQDTATAIKTWVDNQPGPTSLVSTLTATETDAINFDQAFAPK
jgi:hypothetical protein